MKNILFNVLVCLCLVLPLQTDATTSKIGVTAQMVKSVHTCDASVGCVIAHKVYVTVANDVVVASDSYIEVKFTLGSGTTYDNSVFDSMFFVSESSNYFKLSYKDEKEYKAGDVIYVGEFTFTYPVTVNEDIKYSLVFNAKSVESDVTDGVTDNSSSSSGSTSSGSSSSGSTSSGSTSSGSTSGSTSSGSTSSGSTSGSTSSGDSWASGSIGGSVGGSTSTDDYVEEEEIFPEEDVVIPEEDEEELVEDDLEEELNEDVDDEDNTTGAMVLGIKIMGLMCMVVLIITLVKYKNYI